MCAKHVVQCCLSLAGMLSINHIITFIMNLSEEQVIFLFHIEQTPIPITFPSEAHGRLYLWRNKHTHDRPADNDSQRGLMDHDKQTTGRASTPLDINDADHLKKRCHWNGDRCNLQWSRQESVACGRRSYRLEIGRTIASLRTY